MELHDLVQITSLDHYRLHIGFDDGTTGTVDIAQLLKFEGILAPLA